MKRYKTYRAVQPLWNMAFPAHWEVFPLCSMAKEKSICNCTELELLSVYLDAGVVPFSKRLEKRTNATSKDLSKYQRVDPGDFVLNNQQAWRGSVGVSKYTGITSPAYIVLSLNNQLTTEFANYLFRSAIMVNQYLIRSKGVGSIQRNLYWQELKRASVLVPPKDEQDQIVRYLDWQISKINHLIHGYQKQIKLLEERKQKQINDVLESGLDTTEKTIQTKATWMGKTPSHWKQYRVKDIMYEVNNRSKDGSEPHLSMSQKYGLVTDDVDIERRLLSESYVGAKICEANDLVLNRLKAHLGVFALAPQLGVVSPDYTVLRIRQERIIPKYAEYLLKCNDCRRELVIRVRGIVEGFWRLYTNDLYGIYVCIPDLNEQRHILEFIGNIEEKYNNIKKKLEKEIQLLKEYRTRLISDVVTGQIDVRDVVIPDYIPEDDTEIDTDDVGVDGEEVAENAE